MSLAAAVKPPNPNAAYPFENTRRSCKVCHSETSVSAGIDLRRVRNHRGLKPFQLARLNGHTSIARQLGDPRMRRARGAGRRRGEGSLAADGQSAPSPETLLTMLIQVWPLQLFVYTVFPCTTLLWLLRCSAQASVCTVMALTDALQKHNPSVQCIIWS